MQSRQQVVSAFQRTWWACDDATFSNKHQCEQEKKYVFKWLTDFQEQMESIIEAICYVVKFLKQEIALLNKSHIFRCLEMSMCLCESVCEGGVGREGSGSAVLMLEQGGSQFRNFSAQWQPDTSSLAWKSTDADYTIPTLFTNMSHTASAIKSKD